MIDIEKLEFGAELTDDLDFWLNEPAADESVLADWLAALVSGEDGVEFEKSSNLLKVLSAAEVWDEAKAEVMESNGADEYEEDLPIVNWSGIDTEDAAPILAENSGGDFGKKLWEIGGVMNDALDAADVAASDVQALAVTEMADPADEILAEFGGNYVADNTGDDRNIEADADRLLASGEVGITAGEVAGRIEDEPVAADLGEDGLGMWPLIELREVAANDIERRTVEHGNFERKTRLTEPWHNGDVAEERRDLADLVARLAGPVADLVAARLNDELQIMLRSR